MLLPDLLALLLVNRHDGDVPLLDYPYVKSAIQAATVWEMERAGSIVIEKEHVVTGPTRPCPMGQDFETMLLSLDRPEPQTHQWFFLRCEPTKGLTNELFCKRLVDQNLFESKTASHMIFFTKTIYHRLPAGDALVKEWQARLAPIAEAIHGQNFHPADHDPQALMAAVFLDAYRVLPRALGTTIPQLNVDIKEENVRALIDAKLFSPYGAKATYNYYVGGAASLANFGADLFNLNDPLNR